MKSTVETKPEIKEELKLPILMECKGLGPQKSLIVLFDKPNAGMVVYTKNTERSVGQYFTGFSPFDENLMWKKFTGKITLEN